MRLYNHNGIIEYSSLGIAQINMYQMIKCALQTVYIYKKQKQKTMEPP